MIVVSYSVSLVHEVDDLVLAEAFVNRFFLCLLSEELAFADNFQATRWQAIMDHMWLLLLFTCLCFRLIITVNLDEVFIFSSHRRAEIFID